MSSSHTSHLPACAAASDQAGGLTGAPLTACQPLPSTHLLRSRGLDAFATLRAHGIGVERRCTKIGPAIRRPSRMPQRVLQIDKSRQTEGNSYSRGTMHNHPSGDPKPSREDIEMTKEIRKAAEALGIAMPRPSGDRAQGPCELQEPGAAVLAPWWGLIANAD